MLRKVAFNFYHQDFCAKYFLVFLSPESYDSKERGDLICESDDESDSSEKRNSTTSYSRLIRMKLLS